MINCLAECFIFTEFITVIAGAEVSLLHLRATLDVGTKLGASSWGVTFVSIDTGSAVVQR